ncbi:cleft lip and palate transmembrane protein 1-like protein [Capsaspora owczarzaki ATCC 30864]|nr:cleft lip and palate transmembrane protein 1-like protein [Capsaspora owczarzaki ATCC 30864]|eukprot:XP_004346967.1 cleft lip and palate transmembrane protein 1-like protein [Capsaspora owczarzaki ATCC 30864]
MHDPADPTTFDDLVAEVDLVVPVSRNLVKGRKPTFDLFLVMTPHGLAPEALLNSPTMLDPRFVFTVQPAIVMRQPILRQRSNLLSGNASRILPSNLYASSEEVKVSTSATAHWTTDMVVRIVPDSFARSLPANNVPDDLRPFVRRFSSGYQPIIRAEGGHIVTERLLPIQQVAQRQDELAQQAAANATYGSSPSGSSNATSSDSKASAQSQRPLQQPIRLPLTLTIKRTSFFAFRLSALLEASMSLIATQLGFSDKDLDELSRLIAQMHVSLIAITLLHSVFEFLAFRNDVRFWKTRRNLAGLSSTTVYSSFICQFIIFLSLLDSHETSAIILFFSGVGLLIEGWKAWRAFHLSRLRDAATVASDAVAATPAATGALANSTSTLTSSTPEHAQSPREKRQQAIRDFEALTRQYDREAIRGLSWVLYPTVVLYAAYSLYHYEHASWYSWIVSSLANGVYVFGFIAMTPQLYINYRLKSVSHMPWRVFMYRAFNTFIDDVFAFAITMPLRHRIACLRDDFVFIVYLGQRWFYPVDAKRSIYDASTYADEEDGDSDETSADTLVQPEPAPSASIAEPQPSVETPPSTTVRQRKGKPSKSAKTPREESEDPKNV